MCLKLASHIRWVHDMQDNDDSRASACTQGVEAQPFCTQDPLADGPTIQASGTRALERGTTQRQVCLSKADTCLFLVAKAQPSVLTVAL